MLHTRYRGFLLRHPKRSRDYSPALSQVKNISEKLLRLFPLNIEKPLRLCLLSPSIKPALQAAGVGVERWGSSRTCQVFRSSKTNCPSLKVFIQYLTVLCQTPTTIHYILYFQTTSSTDPTKCEGSKKEAGRSHCWGKGRKRCSDCLKINLKVVHKMDISKQTILG